MHYSKDLFIQIYNSFKTCNNLFIRITYEVIINPNDSRVIRHLTKKYEKTVYYKGEVISFKEKEFQQVKRIFLFGRMTQTRRNIFI